MCKINQDIIKQIHEQFLDNPILERLVVASLICSLARKFSNELVVVGGAAVEFYSAASYSWFYPDTSLVVEFPKPPLIGNVSKVIKVSTPYGYANMIGIEDIILDRLKGRVFWQDNNVVPETLLLSHYNNIDFQYLREQAQKELVIDALEKAVLDVDNYKSGRCSFLRDKFYDDKIVESKIIDALEYDVPIEKIIARLVKDDQIKGKTLEDKEEYLRSIVTRSQEIQELL